MLLQSRRGLRVDNKASKREAPSKQKPGSASAELGFLIVQPLRTVGDATVTAAPLLTISAQLNTLSVWQFDSVRLVLCKKKCIDGGYLGRPKTRGEFRMNQNACAWRELVLATRNPAKIALYSQAFANFGWKAVRLEQASRGPEQENGPTPEANALQKAQAAWQPGLTVFADDAGMEVDALDGEPGVQTRRWNGRFPDTISDEEWLEYLLKRLEGIPLSERTARFVTGWALVNARGEVGLRRLVTPFLIAETPIFPLTSGWPVSAVQIRLPEAEPDVARL